MPYGTTSKVALYFSRFPSGHLNPAFLQEFQRWFCKRHVNCFQASRYFIHSSWFKLTNTLCCNFNFVTSQPKAFLTTHPKSESGNSTVLYCTYIFWLISWDHLMFQTKACLHAVHTRFVFPQTTNDISGNVGIDSSGQKTGKLFLFNSNFLFFVRL